MYFCIEMRQHVYSSDPEQKQSRSQTLSDLVRDFWISHGKDALFNNNHRIRLSGLITFLQLMMGFLHLYNKRFKNINLDV